MSELQKQVAPQLVLTPAEKKAADELWNKKIAELKERDIKTKNSVLDLRYDIGILCRDMFDNQRKYGGRTAKDLALKLSVSESTVYLCARFAATYTKTQFEEIKTKGLSWHVVPKLISVQNIDERTQLEDKYANGELTVDEVAVEVKNVNTKAKTAAKKEGKKTENRGGIAPATVLKGVTASSDNLIGKLRELLSVLDEIEEVEDAERKEKLEELVEAAESSLKDLQKQVEKVTTKLGKLTL